jgi:hypothetical protein
MPRQSLVYFLNDSRTSKKSKVRPFQSFSSGPQHHLRRQTFSAYRPTRPLATPGKTDSINLRVFVASLPILILESSLIFLISKNVQSRSADLAWISCIYDWQSD